MRPGQQNKRMRGRGRRGPNPLSRSYESNGPDVKVRGTAAHIAEKYMQLARDAHASGDPVLAESYLQHAEHYFRIIAAAQSQTQQPGGEGQQPHRYNGGGRYDSAEDDSDETEEQEVRRPSPEFPAKPEEARDSPPTAEAQPQADQPAPRRRRRRSGGDAVASANGPDPSGTAAQGNGEDGGAQSSQSDPREKADSEDVNA
jgi:hypothetical protein